MFNSEFCHLHVHNEYSILDGYGSADSYVKKAKGLGFIALGLTNHGNIDGLIQFQKACDKIGLSPILGCEAYIVPNLTIKEKKESRGHITLLIKNQVGYENLCKMLSKANLDGFYYKPRIDFDLLINNCEGLVILTGCGSSFLNLPGGEDCLTEIYKKQPEDIYFEIMPHNLQSQIQINEKCDYLSKQYSLKYVATNDCHFIDYEDHTVHEVLLAVQTNAKWNDSNRFRFEVKGLHLRTVQEMIATFKEQGYFDRKFVIEAIKNTMEIVEKCKNFRIIKKEMYLPQVPGYEDKNPSEFLYDLCEKRLLELSKAENWTIEKLNFYFERLSSEWKLINDKKFAQYFMIVWETVKWCRKNNILTGPGRGSAGGSLIAYLLDITCVDPISYGLLFSRFIAEDRIDYPDIDTDFEDRKRDQVREHLEQLYGKNNVTSISTFLTMKGRAAIRDVARVFELPMKETDEFAKSIESIEDDNHDSIERCIEKTDIGKSFNTKYPEQVKIAIKLEGQIRGQGQHAAGVVISADDLTQGSRGNLVARSNQIVINWGMSDSEHVGLVKLDILGLNALSILSETKKLVLENTGLKIDFPKIPLNDPKVYAEISAGNTTGVFQLNTWSTSKLAKEIKCKNILELSDIIALVRPGPSDSGMTSDYIKRKESGHRRKETKEYEEIVGTTHGIIIYQEQIMQVIYKIGGLSYSVADKIRKVISKKRDVKQFEPFRIMFLEGCAKKKIFSQQQAEKFWEMLLAHSRYSFNLSHSVSYSILAYWTAWCKYYYPTEFICANLSFGSEGKKEEIIKEAKRIGLNIVFPKIGVSDPLLWKAKDNNLYIPFVEIKGIGEKTALSVPVERKEKPKNEKTPVVVKPTLKGFFFSTPEKRKEVKIEKEKEESKSKLEKVLEDIEKIVEAGDQDRLKKYFTFDISIKKEEKLKYPLLMKKVPMAFTDQDLSKIQKLDLPRDYMKGVIQKKSYSLSSELINCTDCKLCYETVYGPVEPSPGTYNVMVVGEAPGAEEDERGAGFIGKSGELLWQKLSVHRLQREDFHITNVCKCYPSQTKTPTIDHIDICRKWIEDEIKQTNACLILSFGNTGLRFFTGKDSGITSLNGTTVWSEEFNVWICWCIHPSSVLRNPGNKRLFEDGIRNFSEKIAVLGDFI